MDATTPAGPVRTSDQPTGLAQLDAAHLATSMQALLAGFDDLTDETAGPSAQVTFEFPGIDGHLYLLPDLVLDTAGRVRLVECNGSNGAGTSVADHDLPRVGHELATMAARGIVLHEDSVVITPESPDTRSTPEIRTRAALRAAYLSQATGRPVRVTPAGRPLVAGPAAVWGPIPAIAERLALDVHGLTYEGRPVAFLNNVNLLVELARRMGLTIMEVLELACLDRPDPVHEGAAMALLSLDKVGQQVVVGRTRTIAPVHSALLAGGPGSARDLEALADAALGVARAYGGAIIKPLAASGGTGVIPVDPAMTREALLAELAAAAAKLEAKYGARWRATCPLAVFEFISIEPARTERGGHRWDLRLQVLATPERTLVTPLSARLCPEPIGTTLDRATAVNNLTGRSTSEANRLPVRDLVAMIGRDDDALAGFAGAAYDLARAAVTWPGR
jgi:hypothetical protein